MSQTIIDNAAAISFNRDLTVNTTVSQSRQLKYFRKGPIQSVAEVEMNVVRRSVYQGVLASYSDDKLGPYDLTFPAEVVGQPFPTGIGFTVNGANQSDNTLNVTKTGTAAYTVLAGTHIKLSDDTGSYIVSADVAFAAGTANGTLTLDQPLFVNSTDNDTITAGADITFSMHMVERPRVSFGPTGLVNHDGAFRFVEVM